MNERYAILAIFLLVLGAILFAYGNLDSGSAGTEFARTCPTGTFFPAATCEDLAARLRWDGALMITGFVVLSVGVVALGLSLVRGGQGIPKVSLTLLGRPGR